MNRLKSKIFTTGFAVVLAFSLALTGYGNSSGSENGAANETVSESKESADFGIFTDIAGENGTTYVNLFEVILDSKYDDYWLEKCASIVGNETAAETVEELKSAISGELYGEEAIKVYSESFL